jgi:hypothetical protein
MCLPAWQKKYTDSNARKNIDSINVADYYGNLENQEKKECNQDNQHRDRDSSQGHNHSQQRNHSQPSNECHYIEQNNGNSDCRQGGTLTVVKVEVTAITQEADPAMTTAMGKEIKTETETAMHTDKMDADKTIKTKTTATPNADTTHITKSDTKKMGHTRSTPTMKAMMDKTLTHQTKAMTIPLTMNFMLPMNLSKIQMTKV